MKECQVNDLTVRQITPEEYAAFCINKDVNPLHSVDFYYRMMDRHENGRIYGGFLDGKLKIAVVVRLIRAWRVFHWMYAPLGYVMDPVDDFEVVKDFMEGIKSLTKLDRVLYFRMETTVELQERDQNGDVVQTGYNNEAYRRGMEKIGFILSPLTVGYDLSKQTRWASVLDLVEYKAPKDGKPASEVSLENFDEYYAPFTEKELMDNFALKTRQHLKLGMRPYIKLRELEMDELDLFQKMQDSAAQHHGFQSTSIEMAQSIMRTYKENCDFLYAWLDTKAYLDYMTKQYEDQAAYVEERKERFEKSPSRRNERALNTARKDLETFKNKMFEAIELDQKHGPEISLAAAMFLNTPTESLYLVSGSDRDYIRFGGALAIQWDAIRRALARKALRYNFWGISGIFDPEDPSYGVFAFKKGFNARVVEYAGEFTYIFMPKAAKAYLEYLEKQQ